MMLTSPDNTSPAVAPTPTLLDALGARLLPRAERTLDRRLAIALKLFAGVLLLALLAQVRLQIGPVPITGQTFGVLLIGAGYGLSLGLSTVLAYLVLGAVGLPLFAGGASGFAYLAGPTGGYLVGFLLAAALLGLFVRRGWDRGLLRCTGALLIASAVIYVPGLLWLKSLLGLDWSAAFAAGLLPFLGGDLVKVAVAASLLPAAWRLLGGSRS